MGILKDVSAAIKDVADLSKEVNIGAGKAASIAKISQQATLQFPIITSRSIDIDTAQSVSKALERQYANFVQIVISLNPYLDLQKDKDMAGYIKRIHQNNPKLLELEESCMNVYSDETLAVSMLFSLNEGASGEVLYSNKKQSFSVLESLNTMAVNDLYKPETMNISLAEASLNHYCKEHGILLEADVPNEKEKNGNSLYAEIDNAGDALELNKIKTKHQMKMDKANYNNKVANDEQRIIDNNLKSQRDLESRIEQKAIGRAKLRNDLKKAEAEYSSRNIVKLADNDVKKSNELVATTLAVTMTVKDGQSFGGNRNFVIGVKGLLHPVQSNEMVSNLLNGIKSGSKFFNFLRWTTGEITFLKDLVLNLDGIKEDVVKKHGGGSHWWTTLKRRKTLAKVKNIGGKNKIIPNASIVCSMEEVAELKEAYGIDLMDVKHIKKLMDQYFLLGFAIVDASQELCYFMFDGEQNFQAVSFRGMEKENNSKNDFKEIYKMINSGRL